MCVTRDGPSSLPADAPWLKNRRYYSDKARSRSRLFRLLYQAMKLRFSMLRKCGTPAVVRHHLSFHGSPHSNMGT